MLVAHRQRGGGRERGGRRGARGTVAGRRAGRDGRGSHQAGQERGTRPQGTGKAGNDGQGRGRSATPKAGSTAKKWGARVTAGSETNGNGHGNAKGDGGGDGVNGRVRGPTLVTVEHRTTRASCGSRAPLWRSPRYCTYSHYSVISVPVISTVDITGTTEAPQSPRDRGM